MIAERWHFRERLRLGPWARDAACREMGVDLFFPTRGEMAKMREAKEVCAGCPVQSECLSHALDSGETFGVRGGLSERERRPLARARRLGRSAA